MKRKFFLVAVAAVSMCVMVSCGNKDNKAGEEKTDTEQLADSGDDDAEASPLEAITKLLDSAYEDLSVIYGPREDDLEPNLDLYGMYCTKGFNQLITETRAADYAQELEEDRFFQGNDLGMWSPWESTPLIVDDVNVEMNGEGLAYATYTLHHGEEWISIGVELEFEDGEWRIADFTKMGDVEASMESLMISYLEANERLSD